jgi:hypothetical protein
VVNVVLGSFLRVMSGKRPVTVCDMGMISTFFNVAFGIMSGCFFVMVGCLLMIFGSFGMMVCTLLHRREKGAEFSSLKTLVLKG